MPEGNGGTKTSKDKKREKGRETTAAPGTAIFTLCHSWSIVGSTAATCIRLHKSHDRSTISLTNKRGSDPTAQEREREKEREGDRFIEIPTDAIYNAPSANRTLEFLASPTYPTVSTLSLV